MENFGKTEEIAAQWLQSNEQSHWQASYWPEPALSIFLPKPMSEDVPYIWRLLSLIETMLSPGLPDYSFQHMLLVYMGLVVTPSNMKRYHMWHWM